MANADSDEEDFVVEELVERKFEEGEEQFLVKWQNYPTSQNTWEPRAHLEANCKALIAQFERRVLDQTEEVKEIDNVRQHTEADGTVVRLYHVIWGDDQPSWEPEQNLRVTKPCAELVDRFDTKQQEARELLQKLNVKTHGKWTEDHFKLADGHALDFSKLRRALANFDKQKRAARRKRAAPGAPSSSSSSSATAGGAAPSAASLSATGFPAKLGKTSHAATAASPSSPLPSSRNNKRPRHQSPLKESGGTGVPSSSSPVMAAATASLAAAGAVAEPPRKRPRLSDASESPNASLSAAGAAGVAAGAAAAGSPGLGSPLSPARPPPFVVAPTDAEAGPADSAVEANGTRQALVAPPAQSPAALAKLPGADAAAPAASPPAPAPAEATARGIAASAALVADVAPPASSVAVAPSAAALASSGTSSTRHEQKNGVVAPAAAAAAAAAAATATDAADAATAVDSEATDDEEDEDEEEYEVEEIVDATRTHYLIKWKGYGHDANTWESRRKMSHLTMVIAKFKAKQKLDKQKKKAAK